MSPQANSGMDREMTDKIPTEVRACCEDLRKFRGKNSWCKGLLWSSEPSGKTHASLSRNWRGRS